MPLAEVGLSGRTAQNLSIHCYRFPPVHSSRHRRARFKPAAVAADSGGNARAAISPQILVLQILRAIYCERHSALVARISGLKRSRRRWPVTESPSARHLLCDFRQISVVPRIVTGWAKRLAGHFGESDPIHHKGKSQFSKNRLPAAASVGRGLWFAAGSVFLELLRPRMLRLISCGIGCENSCQQSRDGIRIPASHRLENSRQEMNTTAARSHFSVIHFLSSSVLFWRDRLFGQRDTAVLDFGVAVDFAPRPQKRQSLSTLTTLANRYKFRFCNVLRALA